MVSGKWNTIAGAISLILLIFCNESNGQESVMNHLSYRSDINHRYAVTWVTAHMENPSDNATEILFKMTLPKTAFISGLIMEVDGRNYTSRVEDKKTAQKIYDEAKKQGDSGGLVEHSGTADQKFEVSTNVEAKGKVIFYLRYEELLIRNKGKYTHNIQIKPGVDPVELDVTVHIKENAEILGLKILKSPLQPDPRDKESSNLYCPYLICHNATNVEQEKPNHAVVSYYSQGPEGLYGELTLTYDVKREDDAGEIMVLDCYFVHFFSPGGLEKMPAHTVFILDVSGSMSGERLEKLKESMEKILNDLQPEDSFELLTFNSYVTSLGVYTKSNSDDMILAKEKISNLWASGGTNINDALIHGIKNALKGCENTANQVVFLTDGEATEGVTDPTTILNNIREINKKRIPLYSLAFGSGPDFRLLNKISSDNRGFARKIPVDSSTSEILRGFYQEIGTPLMADIDIKYPEDAVNQTSIVKNGRTTLQEGNEIIIAGQMTQCEKELSPEINGTISTGSHNFKIPRLSKPKENFIGHLWAYLTIQNLMNTAELTDDNLEREELHSRALSLALKYNFVTKLTSLVVVRPGDLPEEGENISSQSEEEQNKVSSGTASGGHTIPAHIAPPIPTHPPIAHMPQPSQQPSASRPIIPPIRASTPRPAPATTRVTWWKPASLKPTTPSRITTTWWPTTTGRPSTGWRPPRSTTRPWTTTTTPSWWHHHHHHDHYEPFPPSAVCDSICMNGDCAYQNTCSCASGWTGELCDIRICDPECVMGHYISPRNCFCSSGWIGQRCDKWCPEDFITSSENCYKVVTDEKLAWQDVGSKCSYMGLKAASKPSDPIGLRQHIIDNYDIGTLVWLDAQGADSHYVWQQDNSTLSFTDPLWKSGEPKPFNQGDDSCLYLRTRYIDWKQEPESPYGGAHCADSDLAFALCEL